jgi:hypothetical protein
MRFATIMLLGTIVFVPCLAGCSTKVVKITRVWEPGTHGNIEIGPPVEVNVPMTWPRLRR